MQKTMENGPSVKDKKDFFKFLIWMLNLKYYFCTAFTQKGKPKKDDSVAQQVEHIPFKDGVLGSNPS